MALIKYVGKKPSRADTVAGTKTVWVGAGDVQEVPDIVAPRLLRHPDIWELAKAYPVKAEKPEKTDDTNPDAPKFQMQTADDVLVLDNLEKPELRQLAKELGLTIHHTKSEDHFREELAKAYPVKAD